MAVLSHMQRDFNSRPHEEVDDEIKEIENALNAFQLTTSRRGRHGCVSTYKSIKRISTHDLTKRSTITDDYNSFINANFNSRPHEEVDHQLYMILERSQYFNSRPHEEVD